jgi:hypothetical protein
MFDKDLLVELDFKKINESFCKEVKLTVESAIQEGHINAFKNMYKKLIPETKSYK